MTQDDECEACRAIASTAGSRFKDLIGEMMNQLETLEKEFMERIEALKASGGSFNPTGSCGRCTDKYIDFAVSKMVAALAEGERNDRSRQFGASLIKSIRENCAKRGINHLPLTEKAWADMSKGAP